MHEVSRITQSTKIGQNAARDMTSTTRERSGSVLLREEDALYVGLGMLAGLVAFTRDASELAGGASVLFVLLLALSEDKLDAKQRAGESSYHAWIRVLFSWALLWSVLATLELTTARWALPLTAVYGFYYLTKSGGRGWLGVLSLVGVALCHMSAKQFALSRPQHGSLIAFSLHVCLWTVNYLLCPQRKKIGPKEILLDAPLATVRDVLNAF